METKIFLKGFDSKRSTNTSSGLDVQLKGRRKLLPLNEFTEVISQYDEYMEERKGCNTIRLTCQVNPICSNVLFNRISEIVRNEGSSGVSFINYSISGESNIFDGVVFKPKTLDFWCGGKMNYQSDIAKSIGYASTIAKAISTSSSDIIPDKTLVEQTSHPTNAIRDTQLSNSVNNFIYHCGLDIFNNHLIRSNTFKTVCKMKNNNIGDYEAFNTIADFMRDVSGNKVMEKVYFPVTASVDGNAKVVGLHLYEYDDIDTFEDSVKNNLIDKYNGWVGFENKSKIKSYLNFSESTEMPIERPLMYMNGGDFVDMYPGRDLYSFIPKYNHFKRRIEKNWNYCITYPSSSYTPSKDSDPFTDIIEHNNGVNSLKAIYFDENTRADNGVTQLVIYGIAKHGLSKGDYVNIYRTYEAHLYWVVDGNGVKVSRDFESEIDANAERIVLSTDYPNLEFSVADSEETVTNMVIENAEVAEIVDDFIFTVFNSGVKVSSCWVYLSDEEKNGTTPITVNTRVYTLDRFTKKFFESEGNRYYIVNNSYVNLDDKAQRISYKKSVGGIECDYYIRIFSKLPNFKFASGDTTNEYHLYENDGQLIKQYQGHEYEFENHISRLAFAKNIYSDNIGEVVFTDNIDISNLHDNLGRPLTSLYITFIKNNKGYKEWYGYNYDSGEWVKTEISGDTVEFSHAFGAVTCGIRTSEESRFDNDINSINRITQVQEGDGDPSGYLIGGEINDDKRHYYSSSGKLVKVLQEEVWYELDTNFYGDLCYYDNYNAIERHIDYVMHRFNTAQRESIKSESMNYFNGFTYDEIRYDDYDASNDYEIAATRFTGVCNQLREGYYYVPHYEIPIKTFDKLKMAMPDFLTIREITKVEGKENTYRFVTLQNHYLTLGDKSILFDKDSEEYYNLVTIRDETTDNYKVFTCLVYNDRTNELSNLGDDLKPNKFRLFKLDNLDVPSYARVLKDGTFRIIYRDVLNNGFNASDKSIEEYPFTNGAFYINKKIDIYVRRQDPQGFYHLYDSLDVEGIEQSIANEDNYIKDNDIEC